MIFSPSLVPWFFHPAPDAPSPPSLCQTSPLLTSPSSAGSPPGPGSELPRALSPLSGPASVSTTTGKFSWPRAAPARAGSSLKYTPMIRPSELNLINIQSHKPNPMHKVRNRDPVNRARNPKTVIQYTKHRIQNYQDQRVGPEPTILPEGTETPVPVSDLVGLKPTGFQSRRPPNFRLGELVQEGLEALGTLLAQPGEAFATSDSRQPESLTECLSSYQGICSELFGPAIRGSPRESLGAGCRSCDPTDPSRLRSSVPPGSPNVTVNSVSEEEPSKA